jgi:hypothetical protein
MNHLQGRRTFLRRTSAGLLALGAAPWLAPSLASRTARAAGVRRSDLPPPAVGRPPGLSPQEAQWLGLAALAPSGHNAQPWRVRVLQPGRWVVGSARERWLPATDPENRELLLSIGAFVENLALAVGTRGYRLEVQPLGLDPFAEDLLELRLRPGDPLPYPLERLEQRCVVRAPLGTMALRSADVEALRRHDPGAVHFFAPGSAAALALAEATLAANAAQAERLEAQRELSAWIRWDDAEAGAQRNGLTPEALGITGLTGWWVRHFYGPDDVLTASFRRSTLERVEEQVGACGGWLTVTSRSTALPDVIEAGRLFERIALEVRERGIGLHPMSQALEEAPWREHLGGRLALAAPVQFVLRVGYLDEYPRPVSLRMPLARFVTA